MQFEKIIFHSSSCYGNGCPEYHLQVDSVKYARLFASYVPSKKRGEKDTSKTGYFVGMVSDTLYDKLTSIIHQIDFDSLTFKHVNVMDGVTFTIIIYYNGKRKSFWTAYPEENVSKLISVLYEICERNKLTDNKII